MINNDQIVSVSVAKHPFFGFSGLISLDAGDAGPFPNPQPHGAHRALVAQAQWHVPSSHEISQGFQDLNKYVVSTL